MDKVPSKVSQSKVNICVLLADLHTESPVEQQVFVTFEQIRTSPFGLLNNASNPNCMEYNGHWRRQT